MRILAEDHRSRTCPGTLAPQLDLKSSHLTGDDDLPRLDCYMEAGAHYSYFLRFPHPLTHFFLTSLCLAMIGFI